MRNLLTPTDAARRLGVSHRRLLELARAGVVSAVRLNQRVVRFDPAVLKTPLRPIAKT